MVIIRYIFLYIVIQAFAISIADKFNKKLENTIALSLISIIIILYIFGIMNILQIGVITIVILSILILIYTIYKNIKNKTLKNIKEKITSAGNVFFTIMFFIFMIASIYRELTNWDQFSYWSISAKDMFYTNKIVTTIENTVSYPPIPAILQYFFMKVIGMYSQGIEIFATWLIGISFFLPLFKYSNGRKVANIIISIIILCIPAIFNMLIFYESSYPDALLGIVIGYLSYLYFLEEKSKFKTICITMALVLLTLTKPTGIILAIISIITFFLFEIISNKERRRKIKEVLISKEIKTIFIFLIIIIITYVSWCLYKKSQQVQIVDKITYENKIEKILQSINTTIFGRYKEDNNAANSNGNLIEKLYKVTEISTPVNISALGFICISVVIALMYYYKSNSIENKKQFKYITISIYVGLMLYIIALQLAYITMFSTKEMLAHDGMERYIATYLLAILYFIVAFTLSKIRNKSNIYYAILASIIIAITPLNSVANATITCGIYNINQSLYCNAGRNRAYDIMQYIDKDDKVLGICQDKNKILINLMIRYYMYPIKYEVINEITEDNIESIIEQEDYNYIYILEADNKLTSILENKYNLENIQNEVLIKITNNKLEKVY